MKKVFTVFFVGLGVIFFILIVAGITFFIADPLGLKPMLFGSASGGKSTGTQTDKNSALSPAQEKALETFGIDPESVPSSFTPEQEACFTQALGAERVAQIKGGDTPTAAEYFKAKGCL